MKSLRLFALVAAVSLAPAALLGCSDDTKDKVKSAAESARDDAREAIDKAKKEARADVESAGARGAAEYVRGRIKVAEPDDPRSMDVLRGYVDDLPSQVEVSGLEDSSGDGSDADGKVQFTVGDTSACLTVPETGTDAKVTGDAC